MAKTKKSGALARLVSSIEISNPDGTITHVPVSAEDNSTANKILASQMRELISKSIHKFGGLDVMTPKELKELTEAARNVAEFSGEVYKSGEVIETGEKRAEPIVEDVLDFSKLKPQKPSETKSEEEGKQEPEKSKVEEADKNEKA